MRTCLIVQNPRRIPSCVEAIRSLPIDQVWLTGYTENQLPINPIIAAHPEYDAWSIIADDCEPDLEALEAIQRTHSEHPEACVTGYSNLDLDENRHVYNISPEPLRPPRSVDSVTFHDLVTITNAPQAYPGVLQTSFAGFSLTTMTRALWFEYPHHAEGNPGAAADWNLSLRLQQAGVTILAPLNGYVRHVKERWMAGDRAPEKRILVGQIPQEITWHLT